MSGPRVLIVRLSAIGDVVHTLPALAALRTALPGAHLAWVVEALAAPLLEGNRLLDELIVFPRRHWRRKGYLRSLFGGAMWRFFAGMRRRRFDVAIDFQGLTKSAVIPWLSAIPKRIGFGGRDAREVSRWFYTDRLAPADAVRHVVYRNLHLLTELGIASPALNFPFPDLTAESEKIGGLLRARGFADHEKLVFLNPGAGWETKRWPPEHFARLAAMIARELGRGVLVTWGPGEETLLEKTLRGIPAPLRPRIQAAPATTLREFVASLDHAAAVVGGDTGPVHLAAARGVPVVAIYGGSDPARNGPLGLGPVRVLTSPEVACVPCWKVRCETPQPRCMTSVSPENVFDAVRGILKKHAS